MRAFSLIATAVAFVPGAQTLAPLLPGLLSAAEGEAMEVATSAWVAAGVPADLAARVSALDYLLPTLDIVEVAGETGRPIEEVAAVYFTLGERLELDWLRARIEALPRNDRWQTLARAALADDCARERAALTADVLRAAEPDAGPAVATAAWLAANRVGVERFLCVLDEIRAGTTPDLATLSVAMREARVLRAAAESAG